MKLPLAQASTLPPLAYTSNAFFAQEQQACFDGSWVFAGTADEWPNRGAYRTQSTPFGSVLVVRGEDDVLRALLNACRHRGSALAQGTGTCEALVCPYHAWRYALDGRLLAAPAMRDTAGFDLEANRLLALRVEQFGDLVFFCNDANAQPLAHWLGNLPDTFARYRDTAWRCVRRVEFDVACNWKLLLENALEAYHTGTVHRDTLGRQSSSPIDAQGQWCGLWVPSKQSIAVLPGAPAPFPEVDDRQATAFTLVYPNTQLVFAKDCMWWLQVLPVDVEHSKLVLGSCFPESTTALAHFDSAVMDYYQRWDLATPEDNHIVELQQVGQQAAARPAGRFASEEFAVHAFSNWIIERMGL